MIISTLPKGVNRKTFLIAIKKCFLFLIFAANAVVSKAQFASDIYTDFGGFWYSKQTAFNPVLPNKSHDVIGFTYNGITYSTGVNNALLSSNGITFTPGRYRTLPFNSIGGSIPAKGSNIYIALAEQYDGIASGFSSPLPAVKVKDALTDGINGLNIGTGVTNLPSDANIIFPARIISDSAIADNQPDIIYAQLTENASSADVMLFQDSSGKTVGKSNPVQWNIIKSIGAQSLDYYNLSPAALIDTAKITSGFTSNTTQMLRLATFRLADFGITIANASQVKAFVIKPAGTSDPAFIAYNPDALYIIPPIINSQPRSQIVCSGTGQSATFTIEASGNLLTYQWSKDGVNIQGATGSSYTIPVVTASDAGAYQVVVTNPAGKQSSEVAYLNATINRQPFPAAQTIVTGNTVTYSISANNATSFQWKKNGTDISGAVDSIFTIQTLNRGDSGIYTVSVINSAGDGCANMLSDPVSLTPAIVVYSKSTGDINIPATWGAVGDGSGSTPVDFTRDEHTFVLSNRDSGNTLTDLKIAGTLDVKNGVAIIADSTTLDVGWAIRSGSGSISGSSSSGLTVRGNSFLYFTPGKQLLKDFTIKGGTINMLSPLTISGGILPGKLNLHGGTLALEGNKITIASTSVTNTSMVTPVDPAATVTYGNGGAFVVERFIPAKRAFRFISPAVTTTTNIKANWMEGVSNPGRYTNYNPLPGYGTHITGPTTPEDSLDVTQTYNPSLFNFDKNTQTWNAVPNSFGTLTAGRPVRLMVRGSRAVDLNNNEATPSNTIIRTTGSVFTGTYNVDTSLLSTNVGSYNYIGNPYACPIDWRTLTTSGVSSSYYTWDPSLNLRGAYVSYNGLTETNSNSYSKVDHNIQSEQAFLVQSTSATPSVQFKESDKTGTNTAVFRGTAALTKLSVQLLLKLSGVSDDAADGFTAVYGDKFSKAIGDEDAFKFTNLDENMAINRDGTSLSIEGRPLITGLDTLPIKMWQFRQKNYFIKFDAVNFAPEITATLKDSYLKRESPISLSSSTTIPFNINADSASFASNRFSIVFATNSALPVTFTKVKVCQNDKHIQVYWHNATETNIERYEVEKLGSDGRFNNVFSIAARSDNAIASSYHWIDENTNSGDNFYRIKIIEKNGEVSYSTVVRVNLSRSKSGFTVFPNPVKGNTISLQLKDMHKGSYAINIYNNSGQKLHSSTLSYNGGSAVQILVLKQKLPKGKYTLQLVGDKSTGSQPLLVQ